MMSQLSVSTDDIEDGLPADVESLMQSLSSQIQQMVGSSLLMCWIGLGTEMPSEKGVGWRR